MKSFAEGASGETSGGLVRCTGCPEGNPFFMPDAQTAAHPADSLREDGSLARLTIDTIRTLAMDAVQKADSGHPGTPMALAPVMYTLWHDVLRYDPAHADWPNRDRFVPHVIEG